MEKQIGLDNDVASGQNWVLSQYLCDNEMLERAVETEGSYSFH